MPRPARKPIEAPKPVNAIRYREVAPIADVYDRQQLLEVVSSTLEAAMDRSMPPQKQLEEDNRWRVRDGSFRVATLLQTAELTEGRLQDMVLATLHEQRRELEAQQVNASWRPVAYHLREETVHRRARTKAEKSRANRDNYDIFSGREKPQLYAEKLVEEASLRLEIAWIDIEQAPEQDEWGRRTGTTEGTMHGGKIPTKLREEYARAKEIIKSYAAGNVYDASAAPRRPDPSLTQAKVRAAQEALEAGTPPKVVATMLGVSEAELRLHVTLPPAEPDFGDDDADAR